ncbi:uncharacterized protein FOBCDRAFT_199316 [Fusarium oxysporum Fo47]|uniref:Uncharacterized protein n=1 Tax=Fusarium oxysporum Fo47 TaxID=660027 RepID=W9KNF2_FUSOX|nr:uncharacterized protein FOBCDRAFT_199316 [Fusarium oxysporum Fo47]EWZ45936.1 hypothetical protein FOZG_06142 [Fusarium oxysporum Fo47]QKD51995.1 hypothetical protein FOBCDRAFT_199316 [Fusarium oxysporum Fo47]
MASPAENNSLIPEIIWPDNIPDAPEFQEEDETPVVPESIEPDDRYWTEVLVEQDRRLFEIRAKNAKLYSGYLYSHLPNSVIDWELSGLKRPCRVKGLSYYGKPMGSIRELENHLKSAKHLKHDASLAQLRLAPKQTADHDGAQELAEGQNEDYYSHLPNSEVDWETDGPPNMCRVVGLSCYRQTFHRLKRHLNNRKHLLHEVSLAQRLFASEQTTDRQILLPPPPKKPKLAHTISIEELMGDNLVLEDQPFNEALKLPSSFSYPPWLVIPDSQDSEDEKMTPSPAAEPRLKHTIEKTTGDDLVMEDKPFAEASKMPLSFYYPPWGTVQDSDEDSENEPFVCASHEAVGMSME